MPKNATKNGKGDPPGTIGHDEDGRPIVAQPHGGALIPGRGGGPQPGSGRPKKIVKLEARKDYDQLRRLLRKKAADNDLSNTDLIRWLKLAAEIGDLMAPVRMDPRLMVELAGDVKAEVEDEEVLQRIFARWTRRLGAQT